MRLPCSGSLLRRPGKPRRHPGFHRDPHPQADRKRDPHQQRGRKNRQQRCRQSERRGTPASRGDSVGARRLESSGRYASGRNDSTMAMPIASSKPRQDRQPAPAPLEQRRRDVAAERDAGQDRRQHHREPVHRRPEEQREDAKPDHLDRQRDHPRQREDDRARCSSCRSCQSAAKVVGPDARDPLGGSADARRAGGANADSASAPTPTARLSVAAVRNVPWMPRPGIRYRPAAMRADDRADGVAAVQDAEMARRAGRRARRIP